MSAMGEPIESPLPGTPASGRDIAALMDPRPACVVAACHEGIVGFATVIWVTPISHEPPMVAFALRERSRTMGLLRASGRFSLSVPSASGDGVALIEACGNQSGHHVDKGALVAHDMIDDVPVPKGAYSWESCVVDSIQAAGDHLLVVGTVQQAATACDQRDARGRLLPLDTLLCVQHGAYGACNLIGDEGQGGAASA